MLPYLFTEKIWLRIIINIYIYITMFLESKEYCNYALAIKTIWDSTSFTL